MAIPKLALIPAAQGTSLYSVLPSNGVGDFAFTRAGSATRINSQGLIETVASGVSRLNYPLIDGVVNGCPSYLLEPLRTQKIQYSEAFDNNAYWTKSAASVTSGFTSPDGTANAFKLVENSSNSSHSLQSSFVSGASGADTFSVFAKSDGRFNFSIVEDAYTGINVIVNLQDGTITTTGQQANIISLKNGWYRIDVTRADSPNPSRWLISLLDSSNNASYQGDGTSGVYIWGAQLEAGSYPTSYIPNYGTAAGVTRSAETANGSGDASTFNDSEGVLFAEISALADDGTNRYFSLSDGSISNRVNIFFDSNSKLRGYYNGLSGSIIINIDTTVNNKIAFKYKSGDSAFWVNGIEVATRADSLSLVGLNSISFDLGGGSDFYGNTKQIQYFDLALNDSELETLTSWVSFTDMANSQQFTIE